ncbi:MAG: type I polyketide synthase, partial [Pseudomonadota bacterium]
MSGHQDSINPNDIAIIGMALRVPGARNPQQFWENLRDGVESIRDLTEEELIAAGESPERFNRKNYIARAAEMPAMECFDADFFGMSPKEALIMDPQHRQFLECAWEATENATRAPESIEGPVGMFAGCGMGSYFYFNVCSHRDLVEQTGMFLLRHTGNDKDFLATRASYLFDLHGPSVNVQTACSTSLVAVHYACQSLLSGECDMAYAGGVTIELPHRVGYLYEDGEILSPDGHCRAFDHRAAGTVFGSGTGVVVLRRLTDAIADGDPIRAVIKATAINNDGADKAGYLAPSVNGQAEAVVEALGLAGIDADTIEYVECHGTGTSLGDPIEIEALTRAYRQSTDKAGFCKVGSVKTNIGHLDTAAGIVSLIKATLALENEFIPPTLNYEKPNPTIPFDTSPFSVNDKPSAWPRKPDAPRRAGVNSLGVGGTNAHAILEEAPLSPRVSHSQTDEPQTLVITAKSQKALEQKRLQIAEFLKAEPDVSLTDVRHTLQHGQRQFERCSIVTVKDRADAIAVLSDQRSRRPQDHVVMDGVSGATFMFPGGGAQYPGMALSLYRDVEPFRKTVDEGLSYLPADTASTIRQLWLESERDNQSSAQKFLQPSLQLPAILIVEVALARLWASNGIEPSALIGHSMGENTAACIAGVITFENAVQLVHLRGQLFDEVDRGGMLSVPLSLAELQKRLPSDLDIASVNAPELCVVSGSDEALERFAAALDKDDIDATRIAIDIAAHSRMLEPILERFHAFLSSIELSPPSIPVVSNRTGTWLTNEEATSQDYWVAHLRNTVRFADGLATLAEDRTRIYVETGPGRTLSTLAKAHSDIDANQLVASLPHVDDLSDDHLRFLTAIGEVQCLGLETNTEEGGSSTGQRIPLPTYPFQHQPYFLEHLKGTSDAQSSEPLIRIPDIENWGWQPTWKTALADFTLGDDQAPTSILLFGDDSKHCSD